MAKSRRSSLGFSAEQARQALSVLLHEGKLAAGEVQRALTRHRHLVTDLRSKLSALEEGAVRTGKGLLKAGRSSMARTGKLRKARRKPTISAATRAIYRLQGKYLSALRPLSKSARAAVKAIRKKSGVQAAIAAAKRVGKT